MSSSDEVSRNKSHNDAFALGGAERDREPPRDTLSRPQKKKPWHKPEFVVLDLDKTKHGHTHHGEGMEREDFS
jgi:hypothetical protein